MNNLKYLRKSTDISLRKLGGEINLSESLLSKLENDKRMWRLSHIKKISDFFACTTDFLLGTSEFGLYINIGNGFTTINRRDYEIYKSQGQISEVIIANRVVRTASKQLEEKLDPLFNNDIIEEIKKELLNLSKPELEKVLKFIKEFL